jgi:hypothetical protein
MKDILKCVSNKFEEKIWGHDIGCLFIERIYNDGNVFTLSIVLYEYNNVKVIVICIFGCSTDW